MEQADANYASNQLAAELTDLEVATGNYPIHVVTRTSDSSDYVTITIDLSILFNDSGAYNLSAAAFDATSAYDNDCTCMDAGNFYLAVTTYAEPPAARTYLADAREAPPAYAGVLSVNHPLNVPVTVILPMRGTGQVQAPTQNFTIMKAAALAPKRTAVLRT